MFGKLKSLFGNITVEETKEHVVIEGFKAERMTRDIRKVWSTEKINQWMFTSIGSHKIVLNKFFVLDFYFILDQLLANRGMLTNVKTITRIQELLRSETWMRTVEMPQPSRMNFNKLANIKLQPFDFQRAYLEAYDDITQRYQLNGYLLAGTAGSGKTALTLMMAEVLGSETIIVICPKNAVNRVWEANITTHYKNVPTYWVSSNPKPPTGDERYVVFHYEQLDRAIEYVRKHRPRNLLLALDESHNLNEIVSTRTQLFVTLAQESGSRDVVYLSGTPFKAMGAEAVPILRVIDPMFRLGDTEERFKKIFGRDATKALDIIKHRVGVISYKVEKKELKLKEPVFTDMYIKIPNGNEFTLPAIKEVMAAFVERRTKELQKQKPDWDVIYHKCVAQYEGTIRTPADREALRVYKQYIRTIVQFYDPEIHKIESQYCNAFEKNKITPVLSSEMKHKFREAKTIHKYLALKVMGECLGQVLGERRSSANVAILPYIDFAGIIESSEKKTVVFSSHVAVVEALLPQLTAQQMSPTAVYGKTSSDLSKILTAFTKNPDINPLVATYKSLSTAVPLTMADTMILLNMPYRAYELEQAIARIHRLDSDTTCRIFKTFLDTGTIPNISTRSLDIVAWSMAAVENITGVRSPYDLNNTASLEHFMEEFDSVHTEEVIHNQRIAVANSCEPTYAGW